MKYLPLLFVLAAAAVAQDPAPTTPAKEKTEERPDLKPAAKPELRVSPTDLRPATPDLPPLPQPPPKKSSASDLPSRQVINNDNSSTLVPDKVPTIQKPKIFPGSTGDRPNTRTALLPPKTAADLDLRVRYRQAHTKASTDPAVRAAFEESRDAATDYAKRAAMKSYYERLFKKMLSYDKGIAPLVEDRQRYNMRRLTQSRLAPTEAPDIDGTASN